MSVVVDSSGWIEYFVAGPNAGFFERAIEKPKDLIVPAIAIAEVYRWMLRETTESEALAVSVAMRQGKVIALDEYLAVIAAEVCHEHRLPLADGIIYATAKWHSAKLLTQDADLEGLPLVSYVPHPKRKKG